MRKMMACMLGAALCFSMAGAETGVSSAEKASPPVREDDLESRLGVPA